MARAVPIAIRFPVKRPAISPSPTISPTPTSTAGIAIRVDRRTRSRSMNQPRMAAKKGEALTMKSAFATVVWRIERVKQTVPMPRMRPPTSPVGPAARKAAVTRPRSRTANITSTLNAMNAVR